MTGDSTIYPTRTCFDDAVAFCEDRARALLRRPPMERRRELLRLRVVHGVIHVPADQTSGYGVEPGQRIAHAWVEEDDRVWQWGRLADGRTVIFAVEKPEFYAQLRVEAVTRYTLPQMLLNHERTQSTGPWRQDLKLLCPAPCCAPAAAASARPWRTCWPGTTFVMHVREYFSDCPAVLDVIRRGDDPNQDRPR